MSKTRVILPCAGFGTRMSMKPDESKEMLHHNGFPIIDYALDLCKEVGAQPVVITRVEKQDLKDYLNEKNFNGDTVFFTEYSPIGEWPQTILDNRKHWGMYNILLLPDTRFSPDINTLIDMNSLLQHGSQLVFARHKVQDPGNWGVIKNGMICEKPKGGIEGAEYTAWGLIGFTKYAGVELFTAMTRPGEWHQLPKDTTFVELKSFKDVTRGQ